jgi:hypothetical protein
MQTEELFFFGQRENEVTAEPFKMRHRIGLLWLIYTGNFVALHGHAVRDVCKIGNCRRWRCDCRSG